MTEDEREWSDLREETWALFVGYRHWLSGAGPTAHTDAMAAATWARVDALVARAEAIEAAAREAVEGASYNDNEGWWNDTWAVDDRAFVALRAALAALEEDE